MHPFPARLIGTLTCLALHCAGAPAWTADTAPAAPAQRVFSIGNSLTYGVLSTPRFDEILSGHGRPYHSGMHVLWGATLASIWEKREQPSQVTPAFGAYPQALTTVVWDALTLQPSFACQEGPQGDTALATQFIALARARSPGLLTYIYETWPTIGPTAEVGAFARKWSRTYAPGAWDGALYSQDYCRRLVLQLRTADHADHPLIFLLPVGSVLSALDERARAGAFPGVTGIEALYRDGTHLTPLGNYIALCTWYAVLRRESPVGLPGGAILPEVTDAQARLIQATAWSVVTAEPLSGVEAAPAPAQPGGDAQR